MSKSKGKWWTDSWNPVVGCTKISEGCQNCYAEKMAGRLAWMGQKKYQEVMIAEDGWSWWTGWNGETFCDESALNKPFHWRKPRQIFVCSMGDLFHESVPFEFIDKVFATMCLCPWHIFQCLTKRPEKMQEYFNGLPSEHCGTRPLENLWLGVTCENQKRADERIPTLLQIPAAHRFVSLEPLLGEIHLLPFLSNCGTKGSQVSTPSRLNLVIVGAETGSKARYCPIGNIISVVEQCKAAGVPCFVKAVHLGTPEKFKKSRDMSEWPESIRVRQLPF